MAALDHRRKTGRGQYIEISQFEAGIHFVAPVMLDWVVNGREPVRKGNSCDHAAPHGVYRCLGRERWCAITVFTDDEWVALCQVIGNPALSEDARFTTLMGRLENSMEVDTLIEEWTSARAAEDVMLEMQKAGVPAGVVLNGRDLFENPHLNERGFYKGLTHVEMGYHHYPSAPFRFSRTPCEPERPAPCLGQHNEYVCREILGMSDEEFVGLLNENVFQ